MSFFETEFPRVISYRATGGPAFNTTVNQGFSGFEQRNKNWSLARSKWSVSLITPSKYAGTEQNYIDLIRAFFMNVGGRFDAFRLHDWLDFAFSAEVIGTGDGSTLGPYQLIKTYTIGARSYVRQIKKPVMSSIKDYEGNNLADTVVLTDNGVTIPTANYTLDATTGIVTMGGGHAIAAAHIIRASGQFHYPVRFDSDELNVQTEESAVKEGRPITSLATTLVEVRL